MEGKDRKAKEAIDSLLHRLKHLNIKGVDRFEAQLGKEITNEEYLDLWWEAKAAEAIKIEGFEVTLQVPVGRKIIDMQATWKGYTIYIEFSTFREFFDEEVVNELLFIEKAAVRALAVGESLKFINKLKDKFEKEVKQLSELKEGEIGIMWIQSLRPSINLNTFVKLMGHMYRLDGWMEKLPPYVSGILFSTSTWLDLGERTLKHVHFLPNIFARKKVSSELAEKLQRIDIPP